MVERVYIYSPLYTRHVWHLGIADLIQIVPILVWFTHSPDYRYTGREAHVVPCRSGKAPPLLEVSGGSGGVLLIPEGSVR